jgi:protein associated with RNAse G/E
MDDRDWIYRLTFKDRGHEDYWYASDALTVREMLRRDGFAVPRASRAPESARNQPSAFVDCDLDLAALADAEYAQVDTDR